MRARIAEQLEHSGPTVSQTIARMERDGLVIVTADRRLEAHRASANAPRCG
ncbi:MarR family transcriptional regulator [Demequina litorisediminis]|uniref:MarR family transcriptional regulator n=1 Tax=Demequina litorisediminis TaxID=1849022 RepID=UPI003D678F68